MRTSINQMVMMAQLKTKIPFPFLKEQTGNGEVNL